MALNLFEMEVPNHRAIRRLSTNFENEFFFFANGEYSNQWNEGGPKTKKPFPRWRQK